MKKILVMVPCEPYMRKKLEAAFVGDCQFIFAQTKDAAKDHDIEEAEVIIGEPHEEQLKKASSLKWLQLTWAGADKYTTMEGFPENVTLTNASGAFGTIISEYILGSLISIYRSLPVYFENQQNRIWKGSGNDESIAGKTALILGTGNIGSNTAKRLKAFDVNTIGVRRSPLGNESKYFDEIHQIESLDNLLPKADMLICCLPGTATTDGLLNKARLLKMKSDAVLVNIGRGSLIKNDDLIDTLKSGHLKGVVLDVTHIEPLPQDSKLWDMKNVIITPHISGPSFGGDNYTTDLIWKICIDNLSRYSKGMSLNNVVNIKHGY